MHPSILGREGPLPCGSSKQLARAPSPRDRTLPPRLTNPAPRHQCPGTRCRAHTPLSPKRFRLPSKSWSISGFLGRPCLNMSPKIRRQHHDPASTSAADHKLFTPQSPSIAFHDAPSSPLPLSIATISVAVCPAAPTVHWSTADTKRLFTASIVAPTNGSSWFIKGARHEAHSSASSSLIARFSRM